MSAALGLLRLQQVDGRISQIEIRLGQIRETLENDTELVGSRDLFKRAEIEEAQAERARRAAEAETAGQREKIQRAESSLYGGSVRNPKELQDLQADVASLKKQLTKIEELELESMLRLEGAQNNVRQARAHVDQIAARSEVEHAQLVQEQASLSRDLEDLQAERQAAVGAVAGHLLETYEGLRRQRRGVAVAEISDNACGACGTILTAALRQSARHAAELVYCPSCGRILYAG
jgi:predicted  nucleic acid-binding Zn-ribbon protein